MAVFVRRSPRGDGIDGRVLDTAVRGARACRLRGAPGEPALSRFPTAAHFCSWLGLAPGTRISGDKRLGGPPARRTNRLGQALRMAASTARNNQTAIGAAHRRRLSRMDSKGQFGGDEDGPALASIGRMRDLSHVIAAACPPHDSFVAPAGRAPVFRSNELCKAPAEHGGNDGAAVDHRRDELRASMRPPAEHGGELERRVDSAAARPASMRPRRTRGELQRR